MTARITWTLCRFKKHFFEEVRLTTNRTWSAVVELYLQACFDDHESSRATKLDNRLSSVIIGYGDESIAQAYSASARNVLDSLLPPPPATAWNLIEELQDQIVVEIPLESGATAYSNQAPFVTTRILLRKNYGLWKICDILHPCIGCNMGRPSGDYSAGDCMFCEGTGQLPALEKEQCIRFEGTGKCARCRNEHFAGWGRASFLCANL